MSHGVGDCPNENVDIQFPVNSKFWASIVIDVTGHYSYENSVGKYTKEYSLGLTSDGTIYSNTIQVSSNIGPLGNVMCMYGMHKLFKKKRNRI